jgi:hypothetical protein
MCRSSRRLELEPTARPFFCPVAPIISSFGQVRCSVYIVFFGRHFT